MLVLVGSAAMKQHYPWWLSPADYDFFCPKDDFKALVQSVPFRVVSVEPTLAGAAVKFSNGVIYEAGFTENSDSTLAIYSYVLDNNPVPCRETPALPVDYNIVVADVNVNYMLKMSHRFKKNTRHFLKTMDHIHKMREIGATITPELEPLLRQREAETYTYAHPNLNQSAKDFFSGDNVPYIYVHDDIHEAVKHLDKPAYLYYAADGEEVKSDKDKFFACPRHIQLYGVLEEAYVLALERAVIPNKVNPFDAFDMALEKVCTSITSGWFREFAWENYDAVMDLADPLAMFQRFTAAKERGEVRLYDNRS